MNPILVTTTSNDRNELEAIARQLIEQRLAACCQILGPMSSIYRWNEEVETATEWMCTIKTCAELYEQVEALVRNLHSYEVPEIIAMPINNGNAGYLQWLTESTGEKGRNSNSTHQE